MGRWTQYDEPEYRTGGMRRVGYCADSQRYYFQDGDDLYEGQPRCEMGGQMRYIGKAGGSSVVRENNDWPDPPTPPLRSPPAEYENNDWCDTLSPPPQSPSTVHENNGWCDTPPQSPSAMDEKNGHTLWPDPSPPPPPPPRFVLEDNYLPTSPTISTSKSYGSPTRAGISPEPSSPSQPSVSRLRQVRRSILAKCRAVGRFSVRPPSQ